jgi:hypothetical protein
MKTGRCKLCHEENQQLCDSHYLPKKLYEVTRAPQLKSPHPVTLSGTEMRQLSDQLRDNAFARSASNASTKMGSGGYLRIFPATTMARSPYEARCRP